MEILPVELCIKIFKKVDFKTRLNLTLVCRRFNDIISDSPELLENFKLSIDLRNVDWTKKRQRRGEDISDLCLDAILESKREYQHLTISSFNNQHLRVFIEKFSTMKSLDFHGSITKTDFVAILKLLTLVESASFNVDVYDEGNFNRDQINRSQICSRLKYLKCESELNFYLDVFENSVRSLETFVINGYKVFDDYDAERFRNFLIAQSNLKSLVVHCMYGTELFKKNYSDSLTFKLEKLEIKDLSLTTSESRSNFIEFLTKQTQLKSVNVLSSDWDSTWMTENQDNLFIALLKLQNLESLELNFTKCDFENPTNVFSNINPTVRNLSFKNTDPDIEPFTESMILEHITHSLPGLRSLEFITTHSADADDLRCLNRLNLLEELTLGDCEVDAVKVLYLPALKKLQLYAYEDDEDDSSNDQDYWNLFFQQHNNLQHFTYNLELTESSLLAMFEQLTQIKHLELTISNFHLAKLIADKYRSCGNLKYLKVTVEPPSDSKYLKNGEEFYEIFCHRESFVCQLTGVYSVYLEFVKTIL